MADHDFNALVKKAVAAFNAMSPEEQAAHREAQRQSWVRGEMGMGESAAMVKPVADPTDRQRAEAKAREALLKRRKDLGPYGLLRGEEADVANIADALLSFRSEGWEAGREAAAKWHDKNAAACRKFVAEGIEAEANEAMAQEHESAAEHIRALPAPEEK